MTSTHKILLYLAILLLNVAVADQVWALGPIGVLTNLAISLYFGYRFGRMLAVLEAQAAGRRIDE